jgi:3-methyl-2-oxobutanoate hydroxymethyltransferase
MKHTVSTLQQQKSAGNKICMLTVYDYSTATLMDKVGVEILLVGDSLGNTVLGYPDTLSVTMEDMIHHSAAVARGATDALVLTDMPFMSYQTSVYDAVVNAGRLVKEGRAAAVKLEGGRDYCPHIEAIVKAQIPVCAHLGLTPQSVNALGGYKVQGKDEATGLRLLEDARAVEAAGAFLLVLECVPSDLAALVTKQLSIPTIGIGAGAGTDGQVLVYQDMLAMYGGKSPKFAKVFADVGTLLQGGVSAYIEETKSGAFPAEAHGFAIDPEVLKAIENRFPPSRE